MSDIEERKRVVEVCVLASGSKGNCLYVAGGATRLLVDAGLSLKETQARLALLGVELASVDAVLFTHDHTDHCSRSEDTRLNSSH